MLLFFCIFFLLQVLTVTDFLMARRPRSRNLSVDVDYLPQQSYSSYQGYTRQQGSAPQQGYPKQQPQQQGYPQPGSAPEQGYPPQQGYPRQQNERRTSGYTPRQDDTKGRQSPHFETQPESTPRKFNAPSQSTAEELDLMALLNSK